MRPRGPARLGTRIFLWFLGAIVLALATSAGTLFVLHEEQESPAGVVSRTVSTRLARMWDDPRACERYTEQLRETTGLDLALERDPGRLPAKVHRHPQRRGGGLVVFDGNLGYIPVVRGGVVVGALAVRTSLRRGVFHLVLPFVAALVVLGIGARSVSKRLSRPLEDVARAAERFGSGTLSARTGLATGRKRWVAAEVEEVGRAFDAMAARIERIVLDQRELLAAISHELRSPLGRARVALEIARERAEAEAGPRAPLDVIDREIANVDAILADLLTTARTGLSDLRREETHLGPWLERAIAGAADAGPVALDVPTDASAVRIAIDRALAWRAVHNLLVNARTHGHPDDLPLVVTLRATPAHVTIAVTDRGPGFPEDILPRAFDPFVRKDTARTPAARSTGLGLALVRRIAEAHGGSAQVRNLRSSDGAVSGSEASVTFPRAEC